MDESAGSSGGNGGIPLIPASSVDFRAVAVRPMPAAPGDLEELKEKCDGFFVTCMRIEADALAREQVAERWRQIQQEGDGLREIAESKYLSAEELRKSQLNFCRRYDATARDTDALDEVLSRHRAAVHCIDIEAYASGLGNYLPHDVREEIERLRIAVNAASAVSESNPGWESFLLLQVAWRSYWHAIRLATQDLKAAAVRKRAALENLPTLAVAMTPAVENRRPTRRRPAVALKQLTARQVEAAHVVGECKGNLAEAARRMGLDRKTVSQHYRAALRKLGKTALPTPKTGRLLRDRRGQESMADGEDRRQ
jgi:DNA-binding NarL/FixJ family response regulator